LNALARAIDAKSSWTAGHSERVTRLALALGEAMNLDEETLEDLRRGALLHDIGKIAIPRSILDKPGRLTEEEYKVICEHPARGARILEPIEAYAPIMPLVKQHHEWFNGAGYPDGLAGRDITLGARILAVADVYDALISERPYRQGMPHDRAITIIRDGKGTQFDPAVVDRFLQLPEAQREGAAEGTSCPLPPGPGGTSPQRPFTTGDLADTPAPSIR
jgi:putative nucleotidyltransferase with HDIG domain